MPLHARGSLFLYLGSRIAWRLPGRPVAKLEEFSLTELGSGLDMLAAAEQTQRPSLRPHYLRHALDELRHAELFAARARALGPERRPLSRLGSLDPRLLRGRGILGALALCEQLEEPEFLAFVTLSEQRGAEQFALTARLLAGDQGSAAMFDRIGRDERYHIAYSRAALERTTDEARATRALRTIRWLRLRSAWMSAGAAVVGMLAQVWMSLVYFGLLAPFALLARASGPPARGLVERGSDPPPARRAHLVA